MFKKIDVTLSYPTFQYIETHVTFGNGGLSGKAPPMICYSKIDGTIVQEMLNLVPSEFQDKFDICTMEITSTLVPHIDSSIKCSVNYYYSVNDERTVFYRVLNDNQGYPMKKDRDTGRKFRYSDVEEIDSFIAKSGEVWLLDVSKPHNLISSSTGLFDRKAIVLQTSHFTYDQVLKMIESKLNS